MAKELKNYSLYLLAIVGIVAVVGIVLMISGKGSCFGAGSSSETEETLLAEEGGEGLVGHAFSVAGCTDSDAASAKDKSQYLVKGTTTKGTTTKTDSCGTVCLTASCKGQILNPTKLYEYTCGTGGTIVPMGIDCKVVGADYKCVDGACQTVAAPTCSAMFTGQKKCETYNAGLTYTFLQEYQDASCAKTWQPTPCPAGATCDSNNGCCVPSTSLTCKDNNVYSITLNPCTGQSSEVLKNDCVAKKGTCQANQNGQNATCVCTPGYTGVNSCQAPYDNYYYYYKEKVNSDCTKINEQGEGCGYGLSSCSPAKGCCVSVSFTCKDNKVYSTSLNLCTDQSSEVLKDDCTAKKGTCQIDQNGQNAKCVCTPGYTGVNSCQPTGNENYYYYKEKINSDCIKTNELINLCASSCDPAKGCCGPTIYSTCKDNKVYSISLNLCTDQSSEVLKDDCTAKKGTCKAGKCMCTPAYTGKTSCQTTSNDYYNFYKEKVNSDCSMTSEVADWCGYGASSCDPVKGCCKQVSISAACEGDKIHNVTQNSCTGQNTEHYTDCSLQTDSYTGESKTCVDNIYGYNGLKGCYLSSCTLGAEAYYCDSYSAKYYKMTCKNKWQGYNGWDNIYPYVTASSCPPGATCYNPKGECK